MRLNFNFFSKFIKRRNGFHSGGRQYIFWALALVMLIVVGGLIIYSLVFLISNFNEALGPQRTAPSPLKFDIQGFEKLNLIK